MVEIRRGTRHEYLNYDYGLRTTDRVSTRNTRSYTDAVFARRQSNMQDIEHRRLSRADTTISRRIIVSAG